MPAPSPFAIDIPQPEIDAILERVRRYDWSALPDAGGWSAGAAIADMRRLCDYWLARYDWRAQERALNRFPQFIADLGDQKVHFIHVKGSGPKPLPLILSHGWPGSFFEFLHLVEPLAHPERFGGAAEDSFDVIVPSLPGYAFSGRPARPIGPRQTADWFDALMTKTLGYDRYLAQGGDWGSIISTWMAHDHPENCRGLHLNMSFFRLPGAAAATPEEIANEADRQKRQANETGYSQIQRTRPQTLAYAMMDSPVGAASWIVEKFAAWSDLPRDGEGRPDLYATYTEDQLLTNAMIYLVTKSFATSTWMYKGTGEGPRPSRPPLHRIETPTGFAAFPDPVFPPQPRSLMEKSFNITRYTPMPRGGHFAALEQPGLFLDDLRAFARTLR